MTPTLRQLIEGAQSLTLNFHDIEKCSDEIHARFRPEVALAVLSFLEDCETAEDRSNLDGDSAEVVLEQINDAATELLALLNGQAQPSPAP